MQLYKWCILKSLFLGLPAQVDTQAKLVLLMQIEAAGLNFYMWIELDKETDATRAVPEYL